MFSPYVISGYVVSFLVLLFVIIKGGKNEKIAMSVYFAASVIATLIFTVPDEDFRFVSVLGLDIICLATFVVISKNMLHPWPAWAAALQLNAVVWDVLMIIDHTAYTWGTTTILYVSSYGVLGAILWGTIHRLRPQGGRKLSY